MRLSKTTKILVIALLAVIILGGIFLITRKPKKPIVIDESKTKSVAEQPVDNESSPTQPSKEEPTKQSIQPNNQTSTTEEISNIDTSNWQTYTNKEYGFSFRYPREWRLVEENCEQYDYESEKRICLLWGRIVYLENSNTLSGEGYAFTRPGEMSVIISFVENNKGYNIEDIFTSQQKDQLNRTGIYSPSKKYKIENPSISYLALDYGQLKSVKEVYNVLPTFEGLPRQNIDITLVHKDNILKIKLEANTNGLEKSLIQFENIVSTFNLPSV